MKPDKYLSNNNSIIEILVRYFFTINLKTDNICISMIRRFFSFAIDFVSNLKICRV